MSSTQNPYSTQSYNRYSYCMNNPLKYNDPSGYTSEGAAYGVWSMNQEARRMQDFWNEIYIGQIWSYQISEMAYYDAVADEHRFELIGDMQAETVKAQKLLEAFAKANGKPKTNADKIADGGDNTSSNTVNAFSVLFGATGSHIGSHMRSVSRFAPLTYNNGVIYRPALTGFRYGPLSGTTALKLGGPLRLGGNVLGGIGMVFTMNAMIQGDISMGKGSVDLFFGAVGFMGPVGLGVSTIYFVGDTFIPGGWGGIPSLQYNQIQSNSFQGVWFGAHNQF